MLPHTLRRLRGRCAPVVQNAPLVWGKGVKDETGPKSGGFIADVRRSHETALGRHNIMGALGDNCDCKRFSMCLDRTKKKNHHTLQIAGSSNTNSDERIRKRDGTGLNAQRSSTHPHTTLSPLHTIPHRPIHNQRGEQSGQGHLQVYGVDVCRAFSTSEDSLDKSGQKRKVRTKISEN